MRFLKLDGGRLIVTDNIDEKLLPAQYGILSHTWGEDEVTFQDVRNGTAKGKKGYRKILFCAQQSERDGLEHFWVDTCCIDKSNSAELSEALVSMFRWYHNATRCYVYLEDVVGKKTASKNDESDVEFSKSRWFTRGWTLQELLAPRSVEFFSRDGVRMGDKQSLEQQIHSVTGIAVSALRGGDDLSVFGVEERFQWADKRQTAKGEDLSYCLLGIFDVSMSIIYGEGKQAAKQRLLQEVSKKMYGQPSMRPKECPLQVAFERNPNFKGRDQELRRLRQMAVPSPTTFGSSYTSRPKSRTCKIAIVGLGGIGKTQLALEFAYQHQHDCPDCAVFWIPAVSSEMIEQGYREATQMLKLPGCDNDQADHRMLLRDYLSKAENGRWLLVYDNVDDVSVWSKKGEELKEKDVGGNKSKGKEAQTPQVILDYLPKSELGTVLFTTRDRKLAATLAGQNVISLSEMDQQDSQKLLQAYLVDKDVSNTEDDAILCLLERLTYLPLAIVQAAVYINMNSLTIQDYLQLLGGQEDGLLKLLSEDFNDDFRYTDTAHTQNPVATTWLISFTQMRQRDTLAADYLCFMACIDSKDIPQLLLPPGPSPTAEARSLGTLQAYSFLTRQKTEQKLQMFSMHRLVHLATRNWLRQVEVDEDEKDAKRNKRNALASWTDRVALRLANALSDPDRVERAPWRACMPHAHYFLERAGIGDSGNDSNSASGNETAEMCDLISAYADCLHEDGRYRESVPLIVQAVDMARQQYGKEHRQTLALTRQSALIQLNAGKPEQAQTILELLLPTQKRLWGDEDENTLNTMTDLAFAYYRQRRYHDALALQETLVATQKQMRGEAHPDTIRYISNLALTYQALLRLEEAEKLQTKVLEMDKNIYGTDSPRTLTAMVNLAATYNELGRFHEQETLLMQALEKRRRILGEDHPDTLATMHNLALTYGKLGRWVDKGALETLTLAKYKAILGEDHPDTLATMGNLAITYGQLGHWDDEEALETLTLAKHKAVLGEDHPDTLIAMHNLAYTWWSLGRHQEAIELMERCATAPSRVLGAEHKHAQASLESLRLWREGQRGIGQGQRACEERVSKRRKLVNISHR